MPRVRLTTDAPEGALGNVVVVSRSRATDLVNAGLAQRVIERTSEPDALTRRARQRNR